MALVERIVWLLDCNSFGGVASERLLAALPLDENLYCALVFTFNGPGNPTVTFWPRLDDLERQGFCRIRTARARAICDALPRFLDVLEQVDARPNAAREAGQ
jgi:hypothetical protein